MERAKRMAGALRFFGSLETISIQNADDEGMALLMALGEQPRLTKLMSFRVPLTDQVNQALTGFLNLQTLAIASSDFTGRGFPHMSKLESADFQYSPISAEGLRTIAASPKLTDLTIYYPPLQGDHFGTASELKGKYPKLNGLDFEPPQ
jgi:hypothetical protein